MTKRLHALALLALACTEPAGLPPDPPVDAFVPLPPAPPIDLTSLLEAMVDPLHPLTTPGRFSAENSTSWDRRSRSGPEVPEDWFANDDRNTFADVREIAGRTEYVMMDTDGPGVLVKFWAAGPQGTLRVYLDGSSEPAIEAPMSDLFGGRVEPFTEPFAYVSAMGHNFWFPIPYQDGCVVTTDVMPTTENLFYHVQHLRFGQGTEVTTFSAEELAAAAPVIARVRAVLEDPSMLDDALTETETVAELLETTEPGSALYLTTDTGARIRRLALRLAPIDAPTLRQTVIYAELDGELTVRTPVTYLFGSAPPGAGLSTLMSRIDEDGFMLMRWPIPFARSARIWIENVAGRRVTAEAEVEVEDAPFEEHPLHFHAEWQASGPYPTRPRSDWHLMSMDGPGVYLGMVFFIANPSDAWWGEGDDRIYRDGETFPRWFGTGVEDYFGYAHRDFTFFSRPFHAQNILPEGPRSRGYAGNMRWHVLEPIPWEESFRFDLEVWSWADTTVQMDLTLFFYAPPGARSDVPVPALQAYAMPGLTL